MTRTTISLTPNDENVCEATLWIGEGENCQQRKIYVNDFGDSNQQIKMKIIFSINLDGIYNLTFINQNTNRHIDSNIVEFLTLEERSFVHAHINGFQEKIDREKESLKETISSVKKLLSITFPYQNEAIDNMKRNLESKLQTVEKNLSTTDLSVKTLIEEGLHLLEQHQHLESALKKEVRERHKSAIHRELEQSMVGQQYAISIVASNLLRKRKGYMNQTKPLVLLFLGSSGVGKRKLAKAVAKCVNGGIEGGFIRKDMSEYQGKHEYAKLFGAPPGFKGHEEGGQLTAQLQKCTNAVVLLDEIEKAHNSVLTSFLQLFDEGILTDCKDETVHCPEAIFIMTSNLASYEILQYFESVKMLYKNNADFEEKFNYENFCKNPDLTKEITEILKSHFKRNEFLGRITQYVIFTPFTESEVKLLVEIQLNKKKEQAKSNNITLTWENEVIDTLAKEYNKEHGARSLENEVETEVGGILSLAEELGHVAINKQVKLIATQNEHEKLKLLIGFDEIFHRGMVSFVPLSHSDVKLLVEKQLSEKKESLYESDRITLTWEDDVVDLLSKAYNVVNGASSIITEVNREVGDTIDTALALKHILNYDHVKLIATDRTEMKLKLLIGGHKIFFYCENERKYVFSDYNGKRKNNCTDAREIKKRQ